MNDATCNPLIILCIPTPDNGLLHLKNICNSFSEFDI